MKNQPQFCAQSLKMSLEGELERKLDDARCDARARDLAECPRIEEHVRVTELRVVEGVKEFRAELQERILARPAEREFLGKGQIEIVLSGAVEYSHSRVTESKAKRIIRAEKSRFRKAAYVD